MAKKSENSEKRPRLNRGGDNYVSKYDGPRTAEWDVVVVDGMDDGAV